MDSLQKPFSSELLDLLKAINFLKLFWKNLGLTKQRRLHNVNCGIIPIHCDEISLGGKDQIHTGYPCHHVDKKQNPPLIITEK